MNWQIRERERNRVSSDYYKYRATSLLSLSLSLSLSLFVPPLVTFIRANSRGSTRNEILYLYSFNLNLTLAPTNALNDAIFSTPTQLTPFLCSLQIFNRAIINIGTRSRYIYYSRSKGESGYHTYDTDLPWDSRARCNFRSRECRIASR